VNSATKGPAFPSLRRWQRFAFLDPCFVAGGEAHLRADEVDDAVGGFGEGFVAADGGVDFADVGPGFAVVEREGEHRAAADDLLLRIDGEEDDRAAGQAYGLSLLADADAGEGRIGGFPGVAEVFGELYGHGVRAALEAEDAAVRA